MPTNADKIKDLRIIFDNIKKNYRPELGNKDDIEILKLSTALNKIDNLQRIILLIQNRISEGAKR